MSRTNLLSSLLAFALLLVVTTARAQDAWKQGTYRKRQVDAEPIPAATIFNDFGKAQGVPVIVSEDIQGLIISARYSEMKPEAYLDAVTQDYGLFWYYSSGIVYVVPNSSLKSTLLPISGVDLDRLVQTLKRLGVYAERLPITTDPEFGLVYATGPESYTAEVEKIARGIELSVRRQANVEVDVRVFPLRYAWADDQQITIGDRQVAIPGVATILRSVVSDQANAGGLVGTSSSQLPLNRAGLRGRGLISPYNQLIANAERAAINSQVAAAQAQAQFQASSQVDAQVQAALDAARDDKGNLMSAAEQELAAQVKGVIYPDPRLNAIVVRDVRTRMASYEEIIRELDQPVGLVQIKASIVDVDASHSFQLGLPINAFWNVRGREQNFSATTNANNLQLNTDIGNLTIRLANGEVNQFLANLQALELDGHARLLAKPAVVTLDNSEAFLEESEEFFVRIAGLEQVDLFNVTVGTKLNILPHIIQENDGRRVKLTVRIEDGTRSATQTVDEIPVVSRNTINTQAVLLEGQSLLIGGLMREQETKDIRGIPFLSRIPKVGALFRETINQTQRLERMVLLTPTIIDLPYRGPHSGCLDAQSPSNVNPASESIPTPQPFGPMFEVDPINQSQPMLPMEGQAYPEVDALLPPPTTKVQRSQEQIQPLNSTRSPQGTASLPAATNRYSQPLAYSTPGVQQRQSSPFRTASYTTGIQPTKTQSGFEDLPTPNKTTAQPVLGNPPQTSPFRTASYAAVKSQPTRPQQGLVDLPKPTQRASGNSHNERRPPTSPQPRLY